jgi:hypothetical protein
MPKRQQRYTLDRVQLSKRLKSLAEAKEAEPEAEEAEPEAEEAEPEAEEAEPEVEMATPWLTDAGAGWRLRGRWT